MVVLDRVLSFGQSEALPHWLARRIRIANALVILGLALTLTGLPVDLLGGTRSVVVVDLVALVAFPLCWLLIARGHLDVGRAVLMLAANGVILGGVVELGGDAELRCLFFPLLLMAFFVFGIDERLWLAAFVALPIAEYFLTAHIAPSNGLALTVNIIYAPILTFTMMISGAVVFTSIQRNADDKLQRTQARAAQVARLTALGEMSSGIAHEIRNPLAAIHIAAAQIAEHAADPEKVTELGDRIQRIVMRASRIIDGLRSFSRDGSGDPFVRAPVERIIADTLELCSKRLAENGVKLTVDEVPADLAIECRPVQLSQVLMNLLGNAYDAVTDAPERWIRVEIRDTRDQLEIAVSDSGPGVPESLRSRIFEPFFTTKAVDRGTGLGLSLSRGIVESHHGTLELTQSRRGLASC